ncbi:MAG: ROK family protein [Spirochaetaceae bacterium]|nr:ROK family protein [Spirochaetaceae bacterium]
MSKYFIGIDLGGTNTKIGIVSDKGEIIDKGTIITWDFPIPHLFKEELKRVIKDISQKNKIEISSIGGIGIGAPNVNMYTCSIESPPNLPWKDGINLKEGLEDIALVSATNDANAAAIGEKLFGCAKSLTDFIVVTLGTGIGGGIFCDSKLFSGKYGFAGEIGHIVVEQGGRSCNCGRKGCIEKYCSAGGIVKTALELIEKNNSPGSKAGMLAGECQPEGIKSISTNLKNYNPNTLTAKIIAEAAYKGDSVAIETFDITAKYLASFSNDLLNIFSLEAIIFTGGVSQSGEILFKHLEKYFKEEMLDIYKNKNIKLLRSSLEQQDAAIVGAASLVM